MTPVLDRRRLNRALLARQLLLDRRATGAAAVIARLVGMQAQAPLAPYTGLWSRIEGFVPGDLARLLVDRRVVRLVLQRGTIHLITAADALTLRPLVQPLLDRDLDTNTTWAPGLAGLDRAELAAAARALYARGPLTNGELRQGLAERWPDRPPAALAHGARGLLALVQVPPRGLWGQGGQVRCLPAEQWLGRPVDPDPDIGAVVRRYLAAFGPASVADAQTWAGVTGLAEIFARLRPGLRVFRDEDGRELYDLPRAPRPAADTPAPVRLLADFDNILLSHADRRRIIGDDARRALFSRNGIMPGTVLSDGVVRGAWRLDRDRKQGTATLSVSPLSSFTKSEADDVTGEACRLLEFAAPEFDHDVRIRAPLSPAA
jgi:hypothetical protein